MQTLTTLYKIRCTSAVADKELGEWWSFHPWQKNHVHLEGETLLSCTFRLPPGYTVDRSGDSFAILHSESGTFCELACGDTIYPLFRDEKGKLRYLREERYDSSFQGTEEQREHFWACAEKSLNIQDQYNA